MVVGLVMTGFGSLIYRQVGAIPYKFFPDLRTAALVLAGLIPGLWACFGGARQRKGVLWSVIGLVLLLHLEEATVHWVAPVPGSITGTRVGLVGTAGSLLAIASVLMMHIEVEHVRLARDLVERGASDEEAWATATLLRAEGTRRILGIAAVMAGAGVLVFVGEKIIGDNATGGTYILLIGGAILIVGAYFLLRAARPAKAATATTESTEGEGT